MPRPQPPAIRTSAFERIFGARSADILARLDERWRAEAAAHWASAHEEWRALEGKLAALRAREPALDRDELLEMAFTIESLDGIAAAEDTLAALVERFPEWGLARFHLARARADADFEQAERDFVRAVELDIRLFPHALEWVEDYHRPDGEPGRAARVFGELEARWDRVVEQANAERESCTTAERYLPHGLDEGAVGVLQSLFAARPEVYGVWLMQKEVRYFPDSPPYVFVFDIDYMHDAVNVKQDRWLENVLDDIARIAPGMTAFGVVLDETSEWPQVIAPFAPVYRSEKQKPGRWRRALGLVSSVLLLVVVAAVVIHSLVR
ncbi:MAG: hypothetical protein ACU85V_15590 [Gammaproteobacteria bacterium]